MSKALSKTFLSVLINDDSLLPADPSRPLLQFRVLLLARNLQASRRCDHEDL
jgi:hypothetical protein